MKAPIFFMVLLAIGLPCHGQVVWAQQTWGDQSIFHEADRAGNSYLTCNFGGDSVFQNVSIGDGGIAFIKYNTNGKLMWAKSTFGPAQEVYANAIDKNGNYYVAGVYAFSYPGDFGVDNLSIPNDGSQNNIFLVKLDTAGNALWLKGIGGSGYNFVSDLTADDAGNTYLMGSYDTSFEIDGITVGPGGPSEGIWPNYFLAKFNPDGEVVWAHSDICQQNASLKIDRQQNVVLAGSFQNYNYCADTVFPQLGGGETYLEKQSPDGTRKWITVIKNDTASNNYQQLSEVKFDNENNMYLLVSLVQSVSIGDTNLAISSPGNFVIKFDEDGNFNWLNRVPPIDSFNYYGYFIYLTSDDSLHSINLKYVYDTVVVGGFVTQDSFAYDTELSLISYGHYDYVLNKTTGEALSSKLLVGLPEDYGGQLKTDSNNNLYFYISFASYYIVGSDTFTTLEWGAYSTVLLKYEGEQADTLFRHYNSPAFEWPPTPRVIRSI